MGNKEEEENEEEEYEAFFFFLVPTTGSSMSLDGRLALCVPLRALPCAKTWVWGSGESRMLNTPAGDADWGNVAVYERELGRELSRQEEGEGAWCEGMEDVPDGERRLSAARGTFLKHEEENLTKEKCTNKVVLLPE